MPKDSKIVMTRDRRHAANDEEVQSDSRSTDATEKMTATPPYGGTRAEASDRSSPFALIESVLSPSGIPVLGLHLHVAHKELLHSFTRELGHRDISPNSVGVLALIQCHPGISQIALAKLLRLERASAGDRVTRCISAGLIRRVDSPDDKRRYALFLTARGRRILARLRKGIPRHENEFAAHLTLEERMTLIRLLDKLVPRWTSED